MSTHLASSAVQKMGDMLAHRKMKAAMLGQFNRCAQGLPMLSARPVMSMSLNISQRNIGNVELWEADLADRPI